jgi:hypothetical protein
VKLIHVDSVEPKGKEATGMSDECERQHKDNIDKLIIVGGHDM